jgi:hypothetical protein
MDRGMVEKQGAESCGGRPEILLESCTIWRAPREYTVADPVFDFQRRPRCRSWTQDALLRMFADNTKIGQINNIYGQSWQLEPRDDTAPAPPK